jgi:hypothetical protein
MTKSALIRFAMRAYWGTAVIATWWWPALSDDCLKRFDVL